MRQALREYPLPSTGAPAAGPLDDEARERLASLGYFASTAPPKLTAGAPRPRDMTHLFAALDLGSGLFARGDYAAAIPVFERLLVEDPGNLSVALRLAVAHSALGHDDARRSSSSTAPRRSIRTRSTSTSIAGCTSCAAAIGAAPRPASSGWSRRCPIGWRRSRGSRACAGSRSASPKRSRSTSESIALERAPTAALLEMGELAMSIGDTAKALDAYERARELMGASFAHHLQLGVLYLDQRRYAEAAAALDQVPRSHPDHALALFKRAQVAVLLA